jgi:hypothetical protein
LSSIGKVDHRVVLSRISNGSWPDDYESNCFANRWHLQSKRIVTELALRGAAAFEVVQMPFPGRLQWRP